MTKGERGRGSPDVGPYSTRPAIHNLLNACLTFIISGGLSRLHIKAVLTALQLQRSSQGGGGLTILWAVFLVDVLKTGFGAPKAKSWVRP